MSSTTSESSSHDGHSTPLSSVDDIEDQQPRKQDIVTVKYPAGFPALPSTVQYNQLAKQDVGTPDGWIKRNPDLVRLTGKHPFNCESRLKPLFDAGFLTPTHLFFVRNHGAVPQISAEQASSWTLRVHGLVRHSVTYSLCDLKHLFPTVSIPITLVCAGNRRKEQNVVRKSLGFSWGAAGLSTALFTGIYLADLLDYVQPIQPQAKHVIFEGADCLPNGPYGTSQRLSLAKDKGKGMLLAWAMNGLPLEPDHGYPLRMVIPGQIGGRSVKWLNRIEVSSKESQHHLHFWDNKVLPTEISADQAREEKMKSIWYDPKYIINELNVNSAIARPDHDEIVPLEHSDTYLLRGYAYAGGGRRVNRVEISLDDGASWKLAKIDYPEDLYRSLTVSDLEDIGTLDLTDRDTCLYAPPCAAFCLFIPSLISCWCFWSLNVPISSLLASPSSSISLRAMDESLGIQPRDMYWNATGMMNNWWFRIVIHKIRTEGEKGTVKALRFEHPTLAGTAEGGWMERLKSSGMNVLKPSFVSSSNTGPLSSNNPSSSSILSRAISMINPSTTRIITSTELAAHHNQFPDEPWFIVNGQVYDSTSYLKEHPGGADSILLMSGEDATEDFISIHSDEARAKMSKFHIGTFVKEDGVIAASSSLASSYFLQKSTWSKASLASRRHVSHDTEIFTFTFNSSKPLGLTYGQHLFARLQRREGREENVFVQRAYTPVSAPDMKGRVELLIKLYLPSSAFPMGGLMSAAFEALKIGDSIEFKGPVGSFLWLGNGEISWRGEKRKPRRLGMIYGGSGITPILQVIRAIARDSSSSSPSTIPAIHILTANKTETDILCRAELDAYLDTFPHLNYHIHHVVSYANKEWKGSVGRITETILGEHIPIPVQGEEAMVLVCGPEGMVEGVVRPGLKKLGWDMERNVVVF